MSSLNTIHHRRGDVGFISRKGSIPSHHEPPPLPPRRFHTQRGSALTLTNPSSAQAMTIAWDCFDRSSNALVARSAIDLTSPAISCLQAAGAGATNIAIDPGADPMGDQGIGQEPQPEGPSDDTDPDLTSNPSTGDALGIAIGGHLGKLLSQGIADLFNRR